MPALATTDRKPRSWRTTLTRLAITLIAIYLIWCTALYFFQDHLIFRTDAASNRPAWPDPSPYRTTLEITSAEGHRVPALLLRPAGDPSGSVKRPAAMIFHGNWDAAARGEFWPETQALLNMGFVVLVPEYRGYHPAEGWPSQSAISDDMLAFRELLLQTTGVDPAKLIYVGRSLGSGVACELARRSPTLPQGLLLIAPFTSVRAMASRFAVPGFIVKHPFRNDRVLATLDVPVLLVHGDRDRVIPPSHSQQLSSLAKRSTLIIDQGDHNSTPVDDNAFAISLRHWLTTIGITP
jgi:hypothetical protein